MVEALQKDSVLVQKFIEAREVPAVQKAKLAAIRSTAQDALIFAFEGIDDKCVFYHWIKRTSPNLKYEPFVCQGKDKVLELKKIVERDLNGMKEGVYFFIDRDFDDLRGEIPSESVFMTDSYSFENYLVDHAVLEEVLKVELHCHAEPKCRTQIIGFFRKLYKEFLEVTEHLNLRVFLARKCSINQIGNLPSRINRIATVKLTSVTPPNNEDIQKQVVLIREPTEEEARRLQPEFADLDPEMRYRGKFALLFFRRWLDLLIEDRNQNESVLFTNLDREGFVARGPVTLDSLASKSRLPNGLEEFLRRIDKHSKTEKAA